jgi:hypothetical protein
MEQEIEQEWKTEREDFDERMEQKKAAREKTMR